MDKTGGATFPPIHSCSNEYLKERTLIDQASLTPRVYAAIHLRIPESGIDWLDEMIAKAERRDIAIKTLVATLKYYSFDVGTATEKTYEIANRMIAKRNK